MTLNVFAGAIGDRRSVLTRTVMHPRSIALPTLLIEDWRIYIGERISHHTNVLSTWSTLLAIESSPLSGDLVSCESQRTHDEAAKRLHQLASLCKRRRQVRTGPMNEWTKGWIRPEPDNQHAIQYPNRSQLLTPLSHS